MTKQFQFGSIDVQWDESTGRSFWAGAPAFTIWLESSMAGLLLGFQRMVGTERFKLSLHAGGRDSTSGDWALVRSKPTFEEGFQALADVAASAGWGKWQLISVDPAKRIARVRVHHGWEAVAQRGIGVSWGSAYIGGKFAGIFQHYFQIPNCWAEQTAYQTGGDQFDEFIIRESDQSFEQRLDDLLASDNATKADLAVALERLRTEVEERDRTTRELQEKLDLIARQEEAIKSLETPIIEVWEGVLTLPLFGVMDSKRAALTMERLLSAIMTKQAETAILDLTGVEIVDTSTADHIGRLVKAAELLGAKCIITGIRPAVAQTIVQIGIDLTKIKTLATLREALVMCMRQSGWRR